MTNPGVSGNHSHNWELFAILVAAIALRVVFVVTTLDRLPPDTDNYLAIGQNLSTGQGYSIEPGVPTAFRPPGYPVFIALVRTALGSDWSVIALQCLMGAAVALIAALLARSIAGDLFSLAAAVFVAIDPYQIAVCGMFMTEAFFTLLVISTVALFLRSLRAAKPLRYAVAGLAAGAAAMTRPEFLVFIPGALLIMVFAAQPKRRVLCAAVFLVFCAVLPGGWAYRNHNALGSWIVTTTHGGYTHRLAYNAVFYDEVATGNQEAWEGESLREWQGRLKCEAEGISETKADAFNYKMASGFVAGDLERAMHVALVEGGGLWRPYPLKAGTWQQIALGGFFTILATLAAVGVCVGRRRGPFAALSLYLFGATTVVHMYYWSQLRMRIPFHPLLAVLAACGLAAFFGRRLHEAEPVRTLDTKQAYSPAT